MERTNNWGLATLGLAIGLGLLGSTYVGSQTVLTYKASQQLITVKGVAERPILSDQGVWTLLIKASALEIQDAAKQLAVSEAQVMAYLKEAGIAPESITRRPSDTRALRKRAEKGYFETNEIERYEASRQLAIQTNDVHSLEKAAQGASVLSEQGVECSTKSLSYFVQDLEQIKLEMLGAATQNALARAQELAKNSGGALGPVQMVSQGVFQVTPAWSNDVSDAGYSDTSSIPKKVRALVSCSFAMR